MPRQRARSSQSLPAYCRHKGKGLAYVTLNGREVYLGPYGTKASKIEYDRVIAEWLANGRRYRPDGVWSVTVVELLAAFWRHAKQHYRKNGEPTSEISAFRPPLRIVRELYGHALAADFGPLALEACRRRMIAAGWRRGSINRQVGRIRQVWKWGVSRELVPAEVWQALRSVEGLQKGRVEGVVEGEDVPPVADDVVEATIERLPSVVADMVRLQRLTGMRPGEVCSLRPRDLDRSGDVWWYVPAAHKTEHHGKARSIAIGPRGQAILTAYLDRGDEEHCFSPAESERLRRLDQRRRRKTPVQPSQRDRKKARPSRTPRTYYTTASYRRAIHRACNPAARRTRAPEDAPKPIPKWSPNQLRHAAATEIRRRFGAESAQAVLGHANLSTTEIYAQQDAETAARVARELG